MKRERRVSWDQLRNLVRQLACALPPMGRMNVYGVPTGGAVVAALLAERSGVVLVDDPRRADLIVDDICDSGATLARVLRDVCVEGRGCEVGVLHARPGVMQRFGQPMTVVEETDDIVVYPYEKAGLGEEVVTRMIQVIGDDPNRPGLRETPARVLRAWNEMFAGYSGEPPALTAFDGESYDQMIISRDISFMSTCEHHMLPFYGRAHVAYIPNGQIVGISKLARLVRHYARRLQVQERLTSQVADHLAGATFAPRGVAVVMEARHLCMIARGVREPDSVMTTSALRGVFFEKPEVRQELLSLIGRVQS